MSVDLRNESLAIPFDTEAHPIHVVQGFYGPFGHRPGVLKPNLHLEYAVDFGLPIGTIVRAARDGIVRCIYMDATWAYCGTDVDRASHIKNLPNVVLLEHEDGWHSLYLHLQEQSGLVGLGDKVQEGQPLAATGINGWVGDIPNLHFQLFKWVRHGIQKSVQQTFPMKFRNFNESLYDRSLKQSIICP